MNVWYWYRLTEQRCGNQHYSLRHVGEWLTEVSPHLAYCSRPFAVLTPYLFFNPFLQGKLCGSWQHSCGLFLCEGWHGHQQWNGGNTGCHLYNSVFTESIYCLHRDGQNWNSIQVGNKSRETHLLHASCYHVMGRLAFLCLPDFSVTMYSIG